LYPTLQKMLVERWFESISRFGSVTPDVSTIHVGVVPHTFDELFNDLADQPSVALCDAFRFWNVSQQHTSDLIAFQLNIWSPFKDEIGQPS